LFNEPASASKVGLLNISNTTKCDQNHIFMIMNLVTTKAGAKQELLFNDPASASEVGLMNI
jgi:hypothetical protein